MNYREHKGVNQSLLKKYLLPYVPKEKEQLMYEEFEPDYTTVGNMVDCLVTGSNEEFDNTYQVLDSLPSDVVKSIVHWCRDNGLDWTKENVMAAPDYHLFDKRYKDDDKRTTLIVEQGSEYYLAKALDKTIVEKEQERLARTVAYNLLYSQSTSGKIGKNDIRQAVVIGNVRIDDTLLEGCKGMIDLLEYRPANKLFIVKDIKTTSSSTLGFQSSIAKYGYDFQLAFYILMVFQNIVCDEWNIQQIDPRMEELRQICKKDREKNVQHAVDTRGLLIVESTKSPGYPLTYRVETATVAMKEKLLKAIINYLESGESEFTADFIKNNYVIDVE